LAAAVLADAGSLEPCIGLYRRAMLPLLEAALARGEYALHRVLSDCPVARVAVAAEAVRNANTPEDLGTGP
jgi:hypothetical protein